MHFGSWIVTDKVRISDFIVKAKNNSDWLFCTTNGQQRFGALAGLGSEVVIRISRALVSCPRLHTNPRPMHAARDLHRPAGLGGGILSPAHFRAGQAWVGLKHSRSNPSI